jgi:hypothetical protein
MSLPLARRASTVQGSAWLLAILLAGGCLELPTALPVSPTGDASATDAEGVDASEVPRDTRSDLRSDDGGKDVSDSDLDAAPLPLKWKTVSAGGGHACAITQGGELYCWGQNDHGQASADGIPTPSKQTPVKIGDDQPWTHVAAGGTHTCAAHGTNPSRTIQCWGDNSLHQSDPTADSADSAIAISNPLAEAPGHEVPDTGNVLAAGSQHSCVIDIVTSLPIGARCWGAGGDVDVIVNDQQDRFFSPDFEFAEIGVSASGTVALSAFGMALFWGPSDDPLVGPNDDCTEPDPCPPAVALGTVQSLYGLSVGETHACAIKEGGDVDKVFCWGDNESKQVIPNQSGPYYSPIDSSHTAEQVSAGYLHTCAVNLDDDVICWGDNTHGELGVDNASAAYHEVTISDGFRQVAAGDGFTCAVTTADDLYCWGNTDDGRLGIRDVGEATSLPDPQRIEVFE